MQLSIVLHRGLPEPSGGVCLVVEAATTKCLPFPERGDSFFVVHLIHRCPAGSRLSHTRSRVIGSRHWESVVLSRPVFFFGINFSGRSQKQSFWILFSAPRVSVSLPVKEKISHLSQVNRKNCCDRSLTAPLPPSSLPGAPLPARYRVSFPPRQREEERADLYANSAFQMIAARRP